MSLLQPLLHTDPASPRLTLYDDGRGFRMDFSAQTLDNWANKVANMLDEEFEADQGESPLIDLPVSWQSAVIALGTLNSGRTPLFDGPLAPRPNIVFTTVERAERYADVPDCAVVSDDPFGRGVVEAGGQLPEGTVDFGPTVRFYGDAYFGESPELSQFAVATGAAGAAGAQRVLVPGWTSGEEFFSTVVAPIAAGGSVVVVAGLVSTDRLAEIAAAEKVDHIVSRT